MKYKIGNILDFTEDAIGHGCNCYNIMGAGVALAIRRKWPIMFEADRDFTRKGVGRLGHFSEAILNFAPTRIGFNIYTQDRYGVSKRQVNYDALRNGVTGVCTRLALTTLLGDRKNRSLALPRIGAGLAGGEWSIIEPILAEIEQSTGISIIIYSLYEGF